MSWASGGISFLKVSCFRSKSVPLPSTLKNIFDLKYMLTENRCTFTMAAIIIQ